MKKTSERLVNIFFVFTLLLFSFFVFFKLDWGSPFYFHPDERNIATSIVQLHFPNNLNPNFFAYGALPIYSVYFLGVIINSILKQPDFSFTLILLRSFSAILTLLTVPIVYKLAQKIAGKLSAILATIFFTTSIAFLQFSHFGTFEVWLSFFSILMVYGFMAFMDHSRNRYFIFGSIIFGLLVSLKASSIILIIIPVYTIFLSSFRKEKKVFAKIFRLALLFIFLAGISYVLSSPFNFLDSKSFLNSMDYESKVATGVLPVFYTGAFYNTIPVVYQYQKIFPFLINPAMTLISIPAIFYYLVLAIKTKNTKSGLLVLAFLSLFITQSFFFAKWTRYMVPSLPFLYIIIAVFVSDIRRYLSKTIFGVFLAGLLIVNFVFMFSFIKTVILSQDTRIRALQFAKRNIPRDSKILSEVYDLGIVPFNNNFTQISLFNFYDLDNNPNKEFELKSSIKKSDYIILPSQRIVDSRLSNKNYFPEGYNFYSDLFSGKLGFKKVYQTECDIFCKLTYLGNPISNVEQTSNVFDRPTVFIFEKIK